MSNYKINNRYAKALFELASEKSILDAVYSDMELMSEVCAENRQLTSILKNPVIPMGKKIAIMTELFQFKITDLSLQYVFFIIRKHRGINLKGISNAYTQLYKSYKGIKTIHLSVAAPMNEQDKTQIVSIVKNILKGTIDLKEEMKPEILGGFSIRFENYLYDASILNKITRLKKEFEKNEYAR